MLPVPLARLAGFALAAVIAYYAAASLVRGVTTAVPVPPADRLPEDPGLRAAVAARRTVAEQEKAFADKVAQLRFNLARLAAAGPTARDDLREVARQMQAASEAALADYHAIADRSVAYRRDLKYAGAAYAEAAASMARRSADYADPQLKASVGVYAADLDRVAARVGDRSRALDQFHGELDKLKTYIVETQYAVTDLRTFVEAYPDSRQTEARELFDNHVRAYVGRFDRLVRLIDEYRAAFLDGPVTASPGTAEADPPARPGL